MTNSSYRRVRHLGMGGMASVYAAERTRSDGSTMPVACKYMRADLRDHPRLVAMFFQEAALGLALSPGHDGLVTILDCFQDPDENLCLVMELVDGCTLRDLLDVHGPLPHAAVRAIARHALSALAYLHARGVVHRDLSPCNLLLSLTGAVKLSDLGLAKLLDSGAASSGCFRGKPAYASPEQLAGRKVDGRSDLFSLAVVLYRMLSGQMPFGSDGDVDLMLARILEAQAPELPADVPADLRALALGLLAAAPDARTPVSADAALAALDAGGAPVATGIELAALVIEARARLDAVARSEARETPSSSALTQSWPGPARPARRSRRWMRRGLLGVLLGLAVALALSGAYQARRLLESSEPRPGPVPVPAQALSPATRAAASGLREPGAARDTTGPGPATNVQSSEQGAAAAHTPASAGPPRPRHTARRAPARYFAPRD